MSTYYVLGIILQIPSITTLLGRDNIILVFQMKKLRLREGR